MAVSSFKNFVTVKTGSFPSGPTSNSLGCQPALQAQDNIKKEAFALTASYFPEVVKFSYLFFTSLLKQFI